MWWCVCIAVCWSYNNDWDRTVLVNALQKHRDKPILVLSHKKKKKNLTWQRELMNRGGVRSLWKRISVWWSGWDGGWGEAGAQWVAVQYLIPVSAYTFIKRRGLQIIWHPALTTVQPNKQRLETWQSHYYPPQNLSLHTSRICFVSRGRQTVSLKSRNGSLLGGMGWWRSHGGAHLTAAGDNRSGSALHLPWGVTAGVT